VTANDQLLFDKHAEGRFPSEKEILDKLRAM
jgi:predicted Rdx family selenoprotein